jgi:zinc transport system permease protein
MAFFGESIAHSGLLGVALGLLYGINIKISIIAVCAIFAVLLLWLQNKQWLASDSLLSILAHASLSTGLVLLSLGNITGIDIHGFLFGDLLAVSENDLWWIAIGSTLATVSILWFWEDLILTTINEDLAKAEGKNVFLLNVVLMLSMTVVVAISVHVVGVLLISAMMVIPTAAAKRWANTPEQMVIGAVILSILGVVLGMWLSFELDTPPAPSIVMTSSVLFFVLSPVIAWLLRKK